MGMFTIEDIKKRVRQKPFRPLRIVTTAGESYEVSHPELIMIGLRDLQIGMASRRDPAVYDDWACVPRVHISCIEELSTQEPDSDSAPG